MERGSSSSVESRDNGLKGDDGYSVHMRPDGGWAAPDVIVLRRWLCAVHIAKFYARRGLASGSPGVASHDASQSGGSRR